MNFDTFNIVYKEKCEQRYIGKTGGIYRFRLADHRHYIINKVESQPAGLHFNLPDHSLGNMTATILEQVKYNNDKYRKEREKYFIKN